tara:strand:- start:220 stop:366 length:147 start_codon:yes stop_codon:yes gene_type:complete
MEEKRYTMTLLIETTVEAENAEQAEDLFWHYYHNNKNEMHWELATTEK